MSYAHKIDDGKAVPPVPGYEAPLQTTQGQTSSARSPGEVEVEVVNKTLFDLQERLVQASQSKDDAGLFQSDIAREIFEAWYEHARQYAKHGHKEPHDSHVHSDMRRTSRDAFVCLLGIGKGDKQQPFLCQQSLDVYAASSLLEHAAQILTLHRTKLKFKRLLTEPIGDENGLSRSEFLSWIQRVLCGELKSIAVGQNTQDGPRLQSLRTLRTAQDLGLSLVEMAHHSGVETLPIELDPCDYILLAVQPRVDGLIRDETSELLTVICRHIPFINTDEKYNDREGHMGSFNSSKRRQIIKVIASRGLDDRAFTLGWRLGLLDDISAINTLLSRIKAESKRSESSSCHESMALSGNTRPLVSAVLSSIYEIAMNWRNVDVQELGNEGKEVSSSQSGATKFSDAQQLHGDFIFSIQRHTNAIAKVLRVCDSAAKSLYQERESSTAERERSQQFLEALGALLETYPDSGALIDLLLEPLTLEGLSTVAGLSDRFCAKTWSEWLLPFIKKRISMMSLRGISGRQTEQEIIDLLRDCARHFYLGDHRAGFINEFKFGKQLYSCIIEAIRHGYIETEGFPRIAAIIVGKHLLDSNKSIQTTGIPEIKGEDVVSCSGQIHVEEETPRNESALDWVRFALSKEVCHSHKTTRAIIEIVLTLLKLESSSGIGFDFDTSGKGYGLYAHSKTEREEELLSVTTCGSTHEAIACLSLWIELCTSYPVFVSQHEIIVTQLLLTVRDDLDQSVRQRGCSVEWWATAMRMLCALAGCITCTNAPLLFDQVLKIMALCPAGESSSLAAYCGDSTLASIVDKIEAQSPKSSQSSPINTPAIVECTRRAGVLTKQSLARIVPEMLLLDADARVRISALSAMQYRSIQILLDARGAIFGACMPGSTRSMHSDHDGSASIQLNDIDVAIACAAVVAKLAVYDESGSCIVPAIEQLVWSARVTAEGSHLGEAAKEVTEALSFICKNLSLDSIERFCVSSSGEPWLGPLKAISSEWKQVVDSLVESGKIVCLEGKSRRSRSSRRESKRKTKKRSNHSASAYSSKIEDSAFDSAAATNECRRRLPFIETEVGRWTAKPEIECFEAAQDQFNNDLPICEIISIEDAPSNSGKGMSPITLVATAAEVVEPSKSKNPGAPVRGSKQNQFFIHLSSNAESVRSRLAVQARVVPAGEHGATSWTTLNQVREEGRWNWETDDASSDASSKSNGELTSSTHLAKNTEAAAFDFSCLPEAPTHTPAPRQTAKSSESREEKMAVML